MTTRRHKHNHKPIVRVIPGTCGKRRYDTQRQAIGSALASSRKRGTPLRTYRCPTCKGWHLTKQAKRETPTPVLAPHAPIPAALMATVTPKPPVLAVVPCADAAPSQVAAAPAKPKGPKVNDFGHHIGCACAMCSWLPAVSA